MRKKTLVWFCLLLKRQLKNKALLLLLIGIPVIVFIIGRIPDMNERGVPKIGILLMDADELSAETAEQLIDKQEAFEFYYAQTEDQLIQDVIKGKVECGYVFTADLKDKLRNHKYKKSIRVIKNSSGSLTTITNEIVFSALFNIYAKDIALDYVRKDNAFIGIREKAMEMTEQKYDQYVNGAATFHINFKIATESNRDMMIEDMEVKDRFFPLKGVLAVLIYAVSIFGAVQWKKDLEDGVFGAFSIGLRNLSRFLYILCPAILFGISSFMAILIGGIGNGIVAELFRMLLYIVINVAFGVILTYIFPKSVHIISILPVFIFGSFIFCPVFMDVSLVIPAVNVLNKLFLPYYFLI